MGDLSDDVERCLCECACDVERAAKAKDACEGGRVRETKRVLLTERRRLLDEMHASQRGIDAIDHMLHRVTCECPAPRKVVRDSGPARESGGAACRAAGPCSEGEARRDG